MDKEPGFELNIEKKRSEEEQKPEGEAIEWIIGTNGEYRRTGLDGKLPEGITKDMVNVYVRKDGQIGAALKPEFIKDPELRAKAREYRYANREREMWP